MWRITFHVLALVMCLAASAHAQEGMRINDPALLAQRLNVVLPTQGKYDMASADLVPTPRA
jgi:hypothetical protein